MTQYSFKRLRSLTLVGLTALPLSCLHAQVAVKETQDLLAQWIETEKQISADVSDWAVERAVMEDSISFMKDEIARLELTIQESVESASAGERKRAELDEMREQLDLVTKEVTEVVGGYEAKLLALSKQWPETFIASIRRPLDRMPETEEEAENAALTMRLQNIIVILSQFEKFNSVVTKDLAVHKIEGQSREVTTLYYGMSFAYFVDGAGTYAGFGHPKTNGEGWSWTADPDLAPIVTDLVGVFEQTREAAFVPVPAQVVTP